MILIKDSQIRLQAGHSDVKATRKKSNLKNPSEVGLEIDPTQLAIQISRARLNLIALSSARRITQSHTLRRSKSITTVSTT